MKTTFVDVWKDTYRVHSYDVDLFGEIRPHVIMSFLLDSAWAHANLSDFSYDRLNDEGQFWVLSRFMATFHRLPRWGEDLRIETWGKGTDRLFALRDYEAFSPSGEKLVSASSSWLIVDRKTLRPQRLDKLREGFPHQMHRSAIQEPLQKIPERQTRTPAAAYTVLFSDIDVNRHLGSSKFVQWIVDSFPSDIQEEHSLSSLEVNYLAEAQLHTPVSVFIDEEEADRYYAEIRRTSDDACLCRARTGWRNRTT